MYWFICKLDQYKGLLQTSKLLKVLVDEQNKKYTLIFEGDVQLTIDAKSQNADKIYLEALCFVQSLVTRVIAHLKQGVPYILDSDEIEQIKNSCV